MAMCLEYFRYEQEEQEWNAILQQHNAEHAMLVDANEQDAVISYHQHDIPTDERVKMEDCNGMLQGMDQTLIKVSSL
jgi:regulatory protein YycI of two-component signal transduction system YycFG